MNNCLPWDITATDADGGKTAPGAGARVVRRLIVAMLLTAAALDLTRCGLVMAAARHLAPTAGLVTAGLAAAALTARTARGCQAGQRWAGWAALLIGVASSPQAAASGFRSPYMIPDTATAALGILLAITILATAGRMGRQDTAPKTLPSWPAESHGDLERQVAPDRARGQLGARPFIEHWPSTKRDSRWPGRGGLVSSRPMPRPHPVERNRTACTRQERPLAWWPRQPSSPE